MPFICSDCINVLYADDCCIFGLNDQAINSLWASLSEEFIPLQDEGTIKNLVSTAYRAWLDLVLPGTHSYISVEQLSCCVCDMAAKKLLDLHMNTWYQLSCVLRSEGNGHKLVYPSFSLP